MSSLKNLLHVVINESFTPEMAELGRQAAEELASMQARMRELEKMVIGLDTMQRAPKGCQYKTVYNESGELVAVVEVCGTPATTAWTTPTKLAK